MKYFRRTSLFLLFAATIFFIFASPTPAEIKPGSMSLNPQIGWLFFDHTEDYVNFKNNALFGLSFRYFFKENWSVEGLIGYSGTEIEDTNNDVNAYLTSFNVSCHFTNYNKFVPYVTAGLGSKSLDPDLGGGDTDFMFNYGLGVDYFIRENISIRFDAKHLVSFEDSDDNYLATVGLCFFFGGAKAAPPPPPPPKDSDRDGVYDDRDKCPETPAGVKVDSKGCPLDSDNDGVPDYLDKCPGTGKWIRVDKDGCPLDDDKDGVPNHLDQCPLTPAGVKVDAKGCPLDSDNDGVPDYLDKCPGTPLGAKVDSRGCWVLKGVYFDTNKWDIKPQYYPILDEVVIVLKKNPSLKVEIQGHTDNQGSAKYNEKLSGNRAKSVMDYLIKAGIGTNRITAKGYGLTKPAFPNTSPENMAKNRRVELEPVH